MWDLCFERCLRNPIHGRRDHALVRAHKISSVASYLLIMLATPAAVKLFFAEVAPEPWQRGWLEFYKGEEIRARRERRERWKSNNKSAIECKFDEDEVFLRTEDYAKVEETMNRESIWDTDNQSSLNTAKIHSASGARTRPYYQVEPWMKNGITKEG